jgi:ribosomal 30S subunit maturation factor RimM
MNNEVEEDIEGEIVVHQRSKNRSKSVEYKNLVKRRRSKAKHDAKSKKANQKVARRRRK